MNLDTTPKGYILRLYDQGRREKGVAALEFFFFSERGLHKSLGEWAKHWSVSKSTAWKWCRDFEAEEQHRYQAAMTHLTR